MRVLVTGAAGFIGSHLCEALIEDGIYVTAVDRVPVVDAINLQACQKNSLFEYIQLDISILDALEPVFAGVDAVFHLAALVPSIDTPETYFDSNVVGTFNVAETCRRTRVHRLVYAASASCYGIPQQVPTPEEAAINPQYPYALTKYLGEEIILHWGNVYGLSVASLRLFNVFGPRSRTNGTYGAVFGVFLAQKLAGKPLTIVGDGLQTRDFTYVSDVVSAFKKSMLSDYEGILNIGSGQTHSVDYLASLIGGERVHIPKRPGEPDSTQANIEKAKRVLNWTPQVKFEEGVSKVLAEINYWKSAPVWTPESIKTATEPWFKSLEKDS
jgi:UDP-glucose 4-epimerase